MTQDDLALRITGLRPVKCPSLTSWHRPSKTTMKQKPRRTVALSPRMAVSAAWAAATHRTLITEDPAIKNVKIDLKDTFDNSFAEKANAAAH